MKNEWDGFSGPTFIETSIYFENSRVLSYNKKVFSCKGAHKAIIAGQSVKEDFLTKFTKFVEIREVEQPNSLVYHRSYEDLLMGKSKSGSIV